MGENWNGQQKVLRAMLNGGQFSFVLFCWGGIGSMFVLLLLLLLKWAPLQTKWREAGSHELNQTRWMTENYCIENRESGFAVFWCIQIEAGFIIVDLPSIILLCGMGLTFVFRFKARSYAVMASISVLTYFLHFGFFTVSSTWPIRKLSFLPYIMFSAMPSVYSFLFCRSSPLVWQTALATMWLGLSGIGFVVATMAFESYRLLFALVFMPIMREISVLPIRYTTKWMVFSSSKDRQNGITTRKSFAGIFLYITLVFFGIWTRLVVTSFADSELWLYIVVNSVTEIGIRLTFVQRETIMSKMVKKFRSRWFSTSGTVSPHHLENEGTSAVLDVGKGDDDNQQKRYLKVAKQWHALVVVAEMLAEHVGVLVNAGVIYMFQDSVMLIPLRFFSDNQNPFNLNISIQSLLFRTGIQVVGEFLVDGFCLAVEELQSELDNWRTWNRQKAFLKALNLGITALVGTTSALSVYVISVYNCTSQPYPSQPHICNCAILVGSVVDLACKNLNISESFP